jgi:hypothetical protein
MDFLDQYLLGLGEFKTVVSPADTHIWGVRPKLNNTQQRLLFNANAQSEAEFRQFVAEARKEEEQQGMGPSYGIGADPGSPTVQQVIYPEWSGGASYNVGDIVQLAGVNYECVTDAGAGYGPFGGFLDGSGSGLGTVYWSVHPIVNSFAYLTYAPGGLFASFTGNIPENWVKLQNIGFAIIGSSATSIGPDAFRSNDLTSIRIPVYITSIGASAFRDNVVLSTVILSNNITSIGNNAFNGCALTQITLPDNLQSLANGVFKANDITAITIPATVTSIGSDAFQGNNLSSLIIPSTVTSIDNEAFRDNNNLASVNCFVPFTSFIGINAFLNTASPLVIHVRSTDATWNALLGSGVTFQGNTNVTVVNDL